WSTQEAVGTRSIAGLPPSSAIVCVGPPLLASVPSIGSVVWASPLALLVQQLAPWSMLLPSVVKGVPHALGPSSMTEFRRLTGPVAVIAGPVTAVLPAIVTLVNAAEAPWALIAPPACVPV